MHSIPPKDQKTVPAPALVPVHATATAPCDVDYSHTVDSAHTHPVPKETDP